MQGGGRGRKAGAEAPLVDVADHLTACRGSGLDVATFCRPIERWAGHATPAGGIPKRVAGHAGRDEGWRRRRLAVEGRLQSGVARGVRERARVVAVHVYLGRQYVRGRR